MEKQIYYTNVNAEILVKLIKKMIDRNVFFSVNPTNGISYEVGIDNEHRDWMIKTMTKMQKGA